MGSFHKNGVLLTQYYIDKKDVELEELCTTPTGEKFLKHDFITENFHHFCSRCGIRHGVKNPKLSNCLCPCGTKVNRKTITVFQLEVPN